MHIPQQNLSVLTYLVLLENDSSIINGNISDNSEKFEPSETLVLNQNISRDDEQSESIIDDQNAKNYLIDEKKDKPENLPWYSPKRMLNWMSDEIIDPVKKVTTKVWNSTSQLFSGISSYIKFIIA